jgi:phosphate transport system substrate-binding protein
MKPRTRLTPFARLIILIIILGGLFLLLKFFYLDKLDKTSDIKSKEVSNSNYILILSGSNTIGDKLAPNLLKAFLQKKGNTEITVNSLNADEKELTYNENGKIQKILVKAHGTKTGFTDMQDDENILVMASRQIKAEELTLLSKYGDLTSNQSEFIIGLDGIAIISNTNNPLKKLDKSVVAKMFAGELTEWSQLDPSKKGKLKLYSRDEKSGTFDAFNQLVLKSKKMIPDAERLADSRELVDKVSNDPDAIGFVSMAYCSGTKTLAISDGTDNAFYPTKLTVATEDYPLTRKLYFYSSVKSNNTLARDFIKFILSKEGQTLVGEEGFVEFTDKEMTDKPYPILPQDAKRISLNFRFRSGSMDLDNKALIDIGRLAEKTDLAGAEIYLIGFADAQGNDQANLELSKNRADAVKNELNSVGIKVTKTFGLGKEYPVASNDNQEGMQKNRRVEIWMKK